MVSTAARRSGCRIQVPASAPVAYGVDVAQNKAPISVNSAAGKTNFLNVDRVDGKDSSDFLPNDTYVNVVSRKGPGGGGTVFVSADCDSGD